MAKMVDLPPPSEVVGHLERFGEIVRSMHTERVKALERGTFDRALQWGLFLEQARDFEPAHHFVRCVLMRAP